MDEINYTVPPNAQRVGVVGRRPMAHILWHHGPHRRHCWFYPQVVADEQRRSRTDLGRD